MVVAATTSRFVEKRSDRIGGGSGVGIVTMTVTPLTSVIVVVVGHGALDDRVCSVGDYGSGGG